jgi:hypothetical protein
LTASLQRLASALLLVGVLAVALLGTPAASAAPTDDLVAVVPEAGSVTETVTKALPGLPPVETPAVPKVPAPAPSPSAPKLPPSASVPPPPPATPSAEARVPGLGGEADAPSQALGPSAVPGPDAGGAPGGPAVNQGPGRRSIDGAEAAPVRRWHAYVWPAIALRVRAALAPLLSPVNGLVDVVQVPDVFGLLSPSAISGSVGIAGSSERPGPPVRDRRSSLEIALPAEGMGLLAILLVVLLMGVGLVALARLVVGEELFEARHWPGHRG